MIEFITMAKSKGCKIAIDDFGSGYSNFEYLVKLQADYIKIDGSLIKNINLQRVFRGRFYYSKFYKKDGDKNHCRVYRR